MRTLIVSLWRKVILACLLLALLSGTALAEVDLSGMNAKELTELISSAGSALLRLEPLDDALLLFEEDGFSVRIDSSELADSESGVIIIHATLVNDSVGKAGIDLDDYYVNGWHTERNFWDNWVEAHTKTRLCTFICDSIFDSAGIKSYSEIESFEAYGDVWVNGTLYRMHWIFSLNGGEVKILVREVDYKQEPRT